jgi:hypothetical protein
MYTHGYFTSPYAKTHWAYTEDNDFLVGYLNGCHLKLNPSDSRGLRLIVCLGADPRRPDKTWKALVLITLSMDSYKKNQLATLRIR